MFDLGVPEIAIIVVVFILLFYGSGKISTFAKGLGRFSGEFKKGKLEIEKELKDLSMKDDNNKKKPLT